MPQIFSGLSNTARRTGQENIHPRILGQRDSPHFCLSLFDTLAWIKYRTIGSKLHSFSNLSFQAHPILFSDFSLQNLTLGILGQRFDKLN
jgi:hypothetical protein